ncbi:MAG: hypothetical protein P8X50_16840, partial [Maritimibacter sp.]
EAPAADMAAPEFAMDPAASADLPPMDLGDTPAEVPDQPGLDTPAAASGDLPGIDLASEPDAADLPPLDLPAGDATEMDLPGADLSGLPAADMPDLPDATLDSPALSAPIAGLSAALDAAETKEETPEEPTPTDALILTAADAVPPLDTASAAPAPDMTSAEPAPESPVESPADSLPESPAAALVMPNIGPDPADDADLPPGALTAAHLRELRRREAEIPTARFGALQDRLGELSLRLRPSGGRKVAGSSPASPTNNKTARPGNRRVFLYPEGITP